MRKAIAFTACFVAWLIFCINLGLTLRAPSNEAVRKAPHLAPAETIDGNYPVTAKNPSRNILTDPNVPAYVQGRGVPHCDEKISTIVGMHRSCPGFADYYIAGEATTLEGIHLQYPFIAPDPVLSGYEPILINPSTGLQLPRTLGPNDMVPPGAIVEYV